MANVKITDHSYSAVFILHQRHAEKALEMNNNQNGYWISKVPDDFRDERSIWSNCIAMAVQKDHLSL